MLQIIQNRKIWYVISSVLVVLSLILVSAWKLNFGIDFTGGTLVEFEYINERPINSVIREDLQKANLEKEFNIQPVADKGVIIRTQELNEDEHMKVIKALNRMNDTELLQDEIEASGLVVEKRFESIGPVIGEELKKKSTDAILLVLIFIVIYVALVFRKVSKKLGGMSAWTYGIFAIIALVHDILIVLGVFVILGRFFGVEINTPFVAALLTILGYSVNDTIVVFDRIRENLLRSTGDEDFGKLVNKSINETLVRSFNTSFTTILVLTAVFLFGGETIRYFVLALIAGIISGTYSSVFLASPLLVTWKRYQEQKVK